jgi:hypothetical protein
MSFVKQDVIELPHVDHFAALLALVKALSPPRLAD